MTGTLLGSILRKLSKDAQEQISLAMSIADESIGNIRTVRAFAMESKEIGLVGYIQPLLNILVTKSYVRLVGESFFEFR